jgi:hypothetical protein
MVFPAVSVKADQVDFNTVPILEEVQLVEVAHEIEIENRALDRIETHWTRINGLLFFRRWNATRGFWVDPHWILYQGQF